MRKNIFKVLIISIFFGFVACDNEEIVATATGDAFLVTRIAAQDTVYGLALHGFGNKSFSAVSVTDDNGTKYGLTSYGGYTYEYYSETDETDFTTELPTLGSYNFSFSFQTGESGTDVDELTGNVIYPVAITSCEFNTSDSRIELEWTNAEDNAGYYVISLQKPDGTVVFISQALDGSKTSSNISESTSGWMNDETPESEMTYTVVINAYMYEDDKEVDLNIQSKSIAEQTVVWGSAG